MQSNCSIVDLNGSRLHAQHDDGSHDTVGTQRVRCCWAGYIAFWLKCGMAYIAFWTEGVVSVSLWEGYIALWSKNKYLMAKQVQRDTCSHWQVNLGGNGVYRVLHSSSSFIPRLFMPVLFSSLLRMNQMGHCQRNQASDGRSQLILHAVIWLIRCKPSIRCGLNYFLHVQSSFTTQNISGDDQHASKECSRGTWEGSTHTHTNVKWHPTHTHTHTSTPTPTLTPTPHTEATLSEHMMYIYYCNRICGSLFLALNLKGLEAIVHRPPSVCLPNSPYICGHWAEQITVLVTLHRPQVCYFSIRLVERGILKGQNMSNYF